MDKMDYAMKFNSEIHMPIAEWSDQFTKQFENEQIRIAPSREEIDLNLIEGQFDQRLYEFYIGIQDWIVRWKFKESFTQASIGLKGSVNILPVEDVLNWKAWDLMPNEFPQMENFTILDYFYNEAAVGFYLGAPEKGLYYFEFDADPKPLNLDFKGYLEMIKYTKGASYWQLGCIEPIVRTTNKAIEKLNQIDPSITVEGFYKLYDSVRINK